MNRLNHVQKELVINAIEEKRDYFSNRIEAENVNQNVNEYLLGKLRGKYKQYDEILNQLHKSGGGKRNLRVIQMQLSEFVGTEVAIGTMINVNYNDQNISMCAWDWIYSEHEWLDFKISDIEKLKNYEYKVRIEKGETK